MLNTKIIILFFLAPLILPAVTYAHVNSDSTAAETGQNITAREIVNNYISAIGGKEKILAVKDRTTEMAGTAGGREIKMTIYQKSPDKMREIINAGSFIQNIYYNGKEGFMEVGGKKLDIKGIQLRNLKYESSLHLLPNLDSLGIKLKFAGTDTVNGKKTYKILMIFPSGAKWIQYYDPDSWLKVKETKEVKTRQGSYTQETYLSNYHEVAGIKYPFIIKQTLGRQKMNFRVTMISVNDNLNDKLFNINY